MRGRPRVLRYAIALQVAVPTVALILAPAPFGFQMYAGTGWTHVTVTSDTGDYREISPDSLVATYRSDIDWTRRLPEFICGTDETIRTVRVRRWRTSREYSCP